MENFELDTLKEEYSNQDNRATAYPIYVTVQKRFFVGMIEEGHSVCCPHGGGETNIEYIVDRNSDIQNFDSYKEAIQCILDDHEDNECEEAISEIENIKEVMCGYIWIDIEFFLTIKGAEEFMKSDSHNHRKLRTYVKCFNRKNYEMRDLLKTIGFKE